MKLTKKLKILWDTLFCRQPYHSFAENLCNLCITKGIYFGYYEMGHIIAVPFPKKMKEEYSLNYDGDAYILLAFSEDWRKPDSYIGMMELSNSYIDSHAFSFVRCHSCRFQYTEDDRLVYINPFHLEMYHYYRPSFKTLFKMYDWIETQKHKDRPIKFFSAYDIEWKNTILVEKKEHKYYITLYKAEKYYNPSQEVEIDSCLS